MQRCFLYAARAVVLAVLTTPALLPALGIPPQIPPSLPDPVPPVNLTPELRGDLAMAHQQYIAAIEDYRQAPETAIVWNKLGMAWHHLFAMDEAKRDYERALRLKSDYPEALNNLGAVYYAKKDYKKSIRYYLKALRLDPKSAPIYSNLGTAWFARHKTQQGLEAYRQAFALDPHVFEGSGQLVSENLPARERAEQDYCMAELFAQSGHLDRALEYLRKALNEGFDDKRKILADETLVHLRATPQFAQLMTEQKIH